jgi:hypothetical protein
MIHILIGYMKSAENMDVIDKIRANQLAYMCKGFESSEPKSKCANCGKHYLTHGRHLTHQEWKNSRLNAYKPVR